MTREEAAEILKANYPDKFYKASCEAYDIAIKALEAEPKSIINIFCEYQIEWLTNHFDIEFCEEEEVWVIRFLKDTAECFIREMNEVEE